MGAKLLLGLILCVACKNAAPEPPATATAPAPERAPNAASGPAGALPAGHPAIAQGGGAHGQATGVPGLQGAAVAPSEQGSLRWSDPAGWQRQAPSSSMRVAQYGVPGGAGEALMTVFYFGRGMGGGVDDNLQRWWGQFQQPDGRPAGDAAHRERRTVNGMTVHVTWVTGRFAGGGMMGAPQAPQDNQMLLGAIVEAAEGLWFFKMTGPQGTVEGARRGFDELLGSLRVGS